MSRIALVAAVALAVLPGAAPARPHGGTLLALVADSADGRLVAIDVGGGRSAEAGVPPGAVSVAATPRPRLALVASRRPGRVAMVEVPAMRVVRVFGGFGAPCDVGLSRGGRYAYVSDEARGSLAVLDLRSRRVVGHVAVPHRPCRIAVGDDEVWIAHTGGSLLTVLDVREPGRPRASGRVHAGEPVRDLAFAQRPTAGEVGVAHARRLWITYEGSGRLGMLDTVARRVVFRRRVGVALGPLAVDPRERNAWVVDDSAERVLVVEASRGRVLRRIPVGRGVSGIAALVGRAVLVKRDGTLAAYFGEPQLLGRQWTRRRAGGRLSAVALSFS